MENCWIQSFVIHTDFISTITWLCSIVTGLDMATKIKSNKSHLKIIYFPSHQNVSFNLIFILISWYKIFWIIINVCTFCVQIMNTCPAKSCKSHCYRIFHCILRLSLKIHKIFSFIKGFSNTSKSFLSNKKTYFNIFSRSKWNRRSSADTSQWSRWSSRIGGSPSSFPAKTRSSNHWRVADRLQPTSHHRTDSSTSTQVKQSSSSWRSSSSACSSTSTTQEKRPCQISIYGRSRLREILHETGVGSCLRSTSEVSASTSAGRKTTYRDPTRSRIPWHQ